MILGRDLEQRGKGSRVRLDAMSYLLSNLSSVSSSLNVSAAQFATHVLVDKQNGNVLPLGREAVKGLFNGLVVGLCVYNQEILLGVWRLRHVLHLVNRLSQREGAE